jgi:hypothetical protein
MIDPAQWLSLAASVVTALIGVFWYLLGGVW